MITLLYEYFLNLFYVDGSSWADFVDNTNVSLLGENFTLDVYLAFLSTIISIVVIFVLCCLFVYKIVRLIGGLIR